MTLMAVRGLGAICAAGYDVASALGAIVSNVQLFDDLDERGPNGEPITGASVRLPRSLRGFERLCALALLAMEEACAGVEGRAPMALILCAPELKGEEKQILERLFTGSTLPLERKRSVVFARGRSGVIAGLQTASSWLGSERSAACLLVGVDSLLSGSRISRGLERGEVLHEGLEEGYVPGEGAAALLLTRYPDPDSRATIMGVGIGREEAGADPRRPLVGEGFSIAAAQALRLAGVDPAQLAAISHECTGLQVQFEEYLLARGRAPLDQCRDARVFNAGLSAGEAGAAAGALSALMMAFFAEKEVIEGPALSLLRGEGAERGALVIGPVAYRRRT
jgi:3-oxoacyl-[acyl-carrier-protein] synthase-1